LEIQLVVEPAGGLLAWITIDQLDIAKPAKLLVSQASRFGLHPLQASARGKHCDQRQLARGFVHRFGCPPPCLGTKKVTIILMV
jgi:hypothetical protein